MANRALIINLLLLSLITGGWSDIIFYYENQCNYTVWLSASPSIGDADPESGPGTLEIFSMPDQWTGSIWARTKCSFNASYYFSCETGDCGSGTQDCQSPPPTYPVTLLNFDIKQPAVSYEVSLNHGHNVPVQIRPDGGSLVGGTGPCPVVDCVEDISNVCPSPLVAKNKDGCRPGACQPNDYSKTFKRVCKLAHTYPGDNDPPTYKCSGARTYNITFCPS
ncbi:hypothetical protein SLA2020_414120 [Shorea laevis]